MGTTNYGRNRCRKAGISTAVILVFGLVLGGVAQAGPTLTRRARVATGYLATQQQDSGSFPGFSPLGSTADAVVSLVAARRGSTNIESALDYLEAHIADADTVGEKGKLVMAAVAGGRNPRDFGGRDLVQELLDAEQESGQYSAFTPDDPFDGEATDQALAILALAAAPDVDPSTNSLTWLADAQCEDGGWQHTGPQAENENGHCFTGDGETDFFRSDTNTTSVAVQAIAAHPQASATLARDPLAFFRKIRDPRKGGWGYTWNLRLTDANSTALVIQAFVARGARLPDGAMKALTSLQYRLCGRKAGAFAYTYEEKEGGGLRKTAPDTGATIAAIPGLLKRPLPVDTFAVTEPAPSARAC